MKCARKIGFSSLHAFPTHQLVVCQWKGRSSRWFSPGQRCPPAAHARTCVGCDPGPVQQRCAPLVRHPPSPSSATRPLPLPTTVPPSLAPPPPSLPPPPLFTPGVATMESHPPPLVDADDGVSGSGSSSSSRVGTGSGRSGRGGGGSGSISGVEGGGDGRSHERSASPSSTPPAAAPAPPPHPPSPPPPPPTRLSATFVSTPPPSRW